PGRGRRGRWPRRQPVAPRARERGHPRLPRRAVSWPPHGLRLTTPDLELRGMTEADALALGEVKPADVTSDPASPRLGYDVEQAYWRHVGLWKPQDWVLPFTVVRGDELLGVQALEGKDFGVRRVVDSYSWLLPDARGQGVGKQMRAA